VACASKDPIRLDIAEGSFKAQYDLDEELDLSNAKMLVWYDSKKNEELSINRAMVSGFDSQTPGAKTLTVSYKGVACEVNYSVISDKDVDTPFRLSVSIDNINGTSLSISTKNSERIENGIYAISFTMSLVGLNFKGISNYDNAKFNLSSVVTSTTIKVVLFTKGDYKITSSGEIFKINVEKTTSTIYSISITDIQMSDGLHDYILIPSAQFTY
jgi:hypothetical protein